MTGAIERRIEGMTADVVEQVVAQIGESQARLGAQLAETVSGVLLKGNRYVPINGLTGASTGDLMLARSGGRLVGWSLRETGGAQTITLQLHDGADASAPIVAVVKLAAGAMIFGPLATQGGVGFTQGLFMELVGTGVLAGAVYIGGSD